VKTRPDRSGSEFFSTCTFTGLRSGSVTKLHASVEVLLELLADGLADALRCAREELNLPLATREHPAH
jgi:hypothetical protein